MKIVDKILSQLKEHLERDTYEAIETDKFELKDLSTGPDWKELYKSVCAFLNTQGGIIIIGVKEKNQPPGYQFTGFKANDESKLKTLPTLFTDDNFQPIDLSEYIRPDLFEIHDFMSGRICVLFIEKLPDDKKYVMYDKVAYERKLTGDHKIDINKVTLQKELRIELSSAREFDQVPNATLNDLNIDKLNDYIQRLNQGIKVQALMPDILSAQSFLERKKFVVNSKPTLLGMLVCGENLYDFIGGKCQVDGFVESPLDIARNKKVYKDNIIPLLENSIGFVFSNISTGISNLKGGITTFEYPERLIRETVNNALAHRDYSVNKFVNITIDPGKHIEIRNPGKFRNEQIMRFDDIIPIRRIIPIPKAHNPRLADILKSFDRWEGKGWGMSSLTNMALENKIDIAYYILYAEQDIGLFIPKGSVLDDVTKWWLRSFGGYIIGKTNGRGLNEEQETVLSYFYKSEVLNKNERYTIALTPDNNHFKVINELENWGLIFKLSQSPQYHPVYLVDRNLVKFDFTNELRQTYGSFFDALGIEYKDVLNVVYHLNEYGKNVKDINAAVVGDFLYFRKNKRIVDVKNYNDYKRKVRNIINSLTNKKFILKSEGGRPHYSINTDFHKSKSLFSE